MLNGYKKTIYEEVGDMKDNNGLLVERKYTADFLSYGGIFIP
jgi:hypothetical protein